MQPEPLQFSPFGPGDPLDAFSQTRQGQYLRRYLDDLKAKWVVVEPLYFYRDYLAEFAAFYCTSSAGYPNICRRLHFFSIDVDRKSALDGEHGLPTTASVTRAAHKTASLGQRMFPSSGLGLHHLCEAIKEHGLQPIVIPGDIRHGGVSVGFRRERFAPSCAALLRSGYPVLVLGSLKDVGEHAVCAVGFRSATPPTAASGTVVQHDLDIPVLYLHDDNIGPSVRFKIQEDPTTSVQGPSGPVVVPSVYLQAEAPVAPTPSRYPDPTINYKPIVPTMLVTAVPEDIRTSPDALHELALRATPPLSKFIEYVAKHNGLVMPGLTISTRFSRLREYLERDLAQVLGAAPDRLARTRLKLAEEVSPMSLHLGVIRVGDGPQPLFDVLCDTTDNDRHRRVFAHVVFAAGLAPLLAALCAAGVDTLGTQVDAA